MQTTTSMTADEIREKFRTIQSALETSLKVVEVGVQDVESQNRKGVWRWWRVRIESEGFRWRKLIAVGRKSGQWRRWWRTRFEVGFGFVVIGTITNDTYEILTISLDGVGFQNLRGQYRPYFKSPFSESRVRVKDESYVLNGVKVEHKADAIEVIEAWNAYLLCVVTLSNRLEEMRRRTEERPEFIDA